MPCTLAGLCSFLDSSLVSYILVRLMFSFFHSVDYTYLLFIVAIGFGVWKIFGAMPGGGMGGDMGDAGDSAQSSRRKGKAPPKNVSKTQRRTELGAEYRGGRRKF